MSFSVSAGGQKAQALEGLERERARLKEGNLPAEELQLAERLINHGRAEVNLLAGNQDSVSVSLGGSASLAPGATTLSLSTSLQVTITRAETGPAEPAG